MDISWSDVASVSAATLSAVAAVGAWKAAHRSNATADAVASIEHKRWHAELTPLFDITIKRAEGNRAILDVQLIGPLPLSRLERVSISIEPSDDAVRDARLAGSPSQQELDAQVWGPYRFTHGADGADVGGRRVTPISLAVGRGHPFGIELTRPPHWQEGHDRNERWETQWAWRPIKLVLRCYKEGFEPWIVPYDVERPRPDRW